MRPFCQRYRGNWAILTQTKIFPKPDQVVFKSTNVQRGSSRPGPILKTVIYVVFAFVATDLFGRMSMCCKYDIPYGIKNRTGLKMGDILIPHSWLVTTTILPKSRSCVSTSSSLYFNIPLLLTCIFLYPPLFQSFLSPFLFANKNSATWLPSYLLAFIFTYID